MILVVEGGLDVNAAISTHQQTRCGQHPGPPGRSDMMRRRFRARWFLKWMGLVGCVVCILAFLISLRWQVYWMSGQKRYSAAIRHGAAWLAWRSEEAIRRSPTARSTLNPGWTVVAYESFGESFTFRYMMGVRHGMSGPLKFLAAPLWLAFLTLVIPTTYLWWRDRKPPKGHCENCGYNLRGNVSGTCPECGSATQPDKGS